MGKRTSKNKRRSKQNRSDDTQGAKVGPVHVGMSVEAAVTYEKSILNSKAALINVLKHISKYKELRKNELDKKAEIRDTLHRVHVAINKIKKALPEEEDYVKPVKTATTAEEGLGEVKESLAEVPTSSLERELLEIKERLNKLD